MHHAASATIAARPRKAVWAVLLSIAATGLGHIYCGRLLKGLILFFVSFVFAPIIAAAAQHAASTLMLALVVGSLLFLLGIFVYAAVDAGLLARKAGRSYQLKEYNRWYIYLLFVVVALSYPTNLASSIRDHVLQAFKIPSPSMAPAILPGDRIFLNKAIYKIKSPQRGDMVVFVYPDDRRLYYIKRIVALPGDTIEIVDNIVRVNDRPLSYEAVTPAPQMNIDSGKTLQARTEHNLTGEYTVLIDKARPENMPKLAVPHGYCFVLGDNRSQSKDSRQFGPIPLTDIKGRVDYIYWPALKWSRFGALGH